MNPKTYLCSTVTISIGVFVCYVASSLAQPPSATSQPAGPDTPPPDWRPGQISQKVENIGRTLVEEVKDDFKGAVQFLQDVDRLDVSGSRREKLDLSAKDLTAFLHRLKGLRTTLQIVECQVSVMLQMHARAKGLKSLLHKQIEQGRLADVSSLDAFRALKNRKWSESYRNLDNALLFLWKAERGIVDEPVTKGDLTDVEAIEQYHPVITKRLEDDRLAMAQLERALQPAGILVFAGLLFEGPFKDPDSLPQTGQVVLYGGPNDEAKQEAAVKEALSRPATLWEALGERGGILLVLSKADNKVYGVVEAHLINPETTKSKLGETQVLWRNYESTKQLIQPIIERHDYPSFAYWRPWRQQSSTENSFEMDGVNQSIERMEMITQFEAGTRTMREVDVERIFGPLKIPEHIDFIRKYHLINTVAKPTSGPTPTNAEVVIEVIDDGTHSAYFLVEVFKDVLECSEDQAWQYANKIEKHRKARIGPFRFHRAERLCKQLKAVGPDPNIPNSSNGLGATIHRAD